VTEGPTPPRADPAPGQSDGVGRLLTWMPYVLLAALLVAVVRSAAVPISNADTFFHLRYGHEFLTAWTPWNPGHVSTFGHRDWVPTQWLSQIAMAATESAFGLAGVAWLAGVAVLATVVAVYVVARHYADPLPAAVVTIVAVLGCTANLTQRPQVVSYLLILLVTHAWLRTARDLRPRWWIVPATWLWAMVHGMWPIGIAIGVVAVIGITLDSWPRVRAQRGLLLRLVAIPVLSLVVAGLTPVGPRLYAAVLLVGGRSKFHDEWAATDFHESQPAVVAAAIVLIVVIWVRRRTDAGPTWVQILLLLMAAGWSAYAVRTVPVAAMMSVPLVAAALQSLITERRTGPRRERVVVAMIAALAVVALTALVPFTSDEPAKVPSWLDPALTGLPAGTVVQSIGPMGGYLMWRYPELDPVIDGYTDAYTTRHLEDDLTVHSVGPGWDKIMRRNGARYALLPTRSRLSYALTTFEDWRTLHRTDELVMLEAPEGWDR
jgi:hypothetical protein